MNLRGLADACARHPGLLAKRDLAPVAELIGGDGDDAAILSPPGGAQAVAAAEAVAPALVRGAPEVAGIAGVVAALNDVAASGARPNAILDTVVAPDRETLAAILRGVARAAGLSGVPVVGGHVTVAPNTDPALSTTAMGWADTPLRAASARAGDPLSLAVCLEGEASSAGGVAFFSHLRGPRRDALGRDLALLADAAEAGEAWAARDVSMPGIVGSLVQMADAVAGLGAELDLDRMPVPAGVPMGEWLTLFPSYAFLLVGEPEPLEARFAAAGLTCTQVGHLDDSGAIRLAASGETASVWDLSRDPLTGFTGR